MKKLLSVLLTIVLMFALVACDDDGEDNPVSVTPTPAATETASATTTPTAKEDVPTATTTVEGPTVNSKYLAFAKKIMASESYSIKVNVPSFGMTAFAAISGDKEYAETSMFGMTGIVITDASVVYMLDPATKTYYVTTDEDSSVSVDFDLDEFSEEDFANFTSGEEDGLYYEEIKMVEDGVETTSKFYFDGEELTKMVSTGAGMTIEMLVEEISLEVDEALFEIPSGYTQVDPPVEDFE